MSVTAGMLDGYRCGYEYCVRLDYYDTILILQDAQIVESIERKDHDVGNVNMVEIGLTAQGAFYTQHAHPGDLEDEPEGATGAAEDGDLDESTLPEEDNKINLDN